jgi:S-adenosylmethionine decarboxylase
MTEAKGTHILLELYGCKTEILNNTYAILTILRDTVELANCELVDSIEYRFQPNGVSAVLLLKESHISIHTWPDDGYAAVDIFTCGDKATPHASVQYLIDSFEANRYWTKSVLRGLKNDPIKKVCKDEKLAFDENGSV